MRITKKLLRETKKSLSERIRVVIRMSPEQVNQEYVRMFPAAERSAYDVGEMRDSILQWALESLIPSHWCD
jgi:hypothetical protein